MKKFLSLMLMCVLSLTMFAFVGCTNTNNVKLEGGPSLKEDVSGNGSFVVRKGDYVYFASGYVATSDLGSAGLTNELGKVTNGAIYRAKIEKTQIEIENKDKKEGESDKKLVDSLKLSKAELLVSKVAGFDNAGLYIFGNKLYFASPSTVKNNSGTTLYSLLTFYSVDLNGENLTEVYQTKEFSSGSYSFIMFDKTVYLIINTGSQILRVDLNGNETVLAEDTTGAVFASSKDLKNNAYALSEAEKYVYYTTKNSKTTDTRDYGTTLYKVNILTNEKTKLFEQDYITINLVKLENGKLFYTRNEIQSGTSATSDKYLYINTLSGEDFSKSESKYSYQSTLSNIYRIEASENVGYVYVNNGRLILKSDEGTVKELSSSATKVLFVSGNYVYYVSSSAIYRVDVSAKSPTGVKLSSSSTINTSYIDNVNDDLIFFYVKNSDTSLYETHFVDIKNFITNTTKPVKAVA